MSKFLHLIGGPLDGAVMPVNPRFNRPPTHLAIHAPLSGWTCYEHEHAGGLADYDVYRINGEPLTPPNMPKGQIYNLLYRGPLSQTEAQQIQQDIQQRRRKRRDDDGDEES